MALYLLGDGSPELAPFGRAFFSATQRALEHDASPFGSPRFTLSLADGTKVEVWSIKSLEEKHLIVRGAGTGSSGNIRLHAIPYSLINGIERLPELQRLQRKNPRRARRRRSLLHLTPFGRGTPEN